jgi:hypothetical protein
VASEGQHYLPISDAMGRDIDSGKAAGRDIADFLPDHVAQEIWDQSNPGPVHAETLVPISKAEATRRTTFDGDSMPRFPATRRVIPAPYRRDRVVGGKHGKTWTTLLAGDVRPGDIVPDIGLVVDRSERTVYATREHVTRGEEAFYRPLVSLVSGPDGKLPEGHDPDDLVAIEPAFAITGAGGKVVIFSYRAEVRVFR